MFLTAEALIPNIVSRLRAQACQRIVTGALEAAREDNEELLEEVNDLLATLLYHKWPPLQTVHGYPVECGYLRFAHYDEPWLILGCMQDDGSHFRNFFARSAGGSAYDGQIGFVLLQPQDDRLPSHTYLRATVVLPEGEHCWDNYAHRIEPEYIDQLLGLVE